MIRSVVAFFFFAVVVCATIILRAGDSGPGRASVQSTPVEPMVTDPGPGADVTRADVAPMALPAANSRISVPGQIQAPPAVRTDTALTVEDMTANVLAELGLLPDSASTLPDQTEARAATAEVLAGLGDVIGDAPTVQERETLQSLVVAALREGQADAAIDQTVNVAANEGRIAVPEELVTPEGRVDTATLLANILVEAQVVTGQRPPPEPPVGITDPTGLDVRFVKDADGATESRFYTVQRGDSLSAIAVKFYGNVQKYPAIYDANRTTLTSPDRIRVGQRLLIPEI